MVGRIKYASDVAAPVDVAFSYVDNHIVHSESHDVGAVFETTIPVGPWSYRLDTEVTEYRRNAVIALTGRNLGMTCTFRFDQLGCGRSILTLEVDYPARTGVSGFLTNKFVGAFGNTAVRRTENRLRQGIERYHGLDPVGRIG